MKALNLETADRDQLIEKIHEQHARIKNLTDNLEIKQTALTVAYRKLQSIRREVVGIALDIIS